MSINERDPSIGSSLLPLDRSQGRKFEVRKNLASGAWEYRIVYPDGSRSLPRTGYWNKQAAVAAAREERDGEGEWH